VNECKPVLDGKTLCVTPFGIDVVGITEALALIGAVTGGTMANQRKVGAYTRPLFSST